MAPNPPSTSHRRSSILAFRPHTSHAPPPPSPSVHSTNTLIAQASNEALRRIAKEQHPRYHEASRWSSVVPADTPEEGQFRSPVAAESSHSHGYASQRGIGLGSFAKSLARRASTTLNGPGKTRKGSKDRFELPISDPIPISEADVTGPACERPSTALPVDHLFSSQARPSTSAGGLSKSRSFLRRMKSYGKSRRDALSNPSGLAAADSTLSYPLHSVQSAPGFQFHQFDWPRPRPGAAARASAREAQASASNMHLPGRLMRKDTKCSQGTRDSMLTDVDMLGATDSVLGIDDFDDDRLESLRLDPACVLPPEIASHIFSFLDYKTLDTAVDVSRAWKDLCCSENRALWRHVFLDRFAPRDRVSPLPLQMGGNGIGMASRDGRDWKRMYEARLAIERNWAQGTPDAVYFQGHTDSVYCAQFDEHKIITGSRDRTIRVWDINTYECLKVVGGPASKPVKPGPGEAQLDCHAMTKYAGKNLNGTTEGDELYYVPSDYHSASVLCLQFDDEIMVTGSSDSTCIVWDIKTFEPIRRLRHHTQGVLDVCFDDRFIVSCSKDFHICVWDRRTGDLVRVLEGHKGPVNAVQMRGSLLVSASGDGISKLWDLNDFKCIRDFHSRDRGLAAVEFSDDAKWVLAGGNDQVIYKYEVASGELKTTFRGHQGLVRSLFLDTQNNRVVSGSYDQAIRVYNFNGGCALGGDANAAGGNTGNNANNSSDAATGRTGAYENWTTSWILSAKSDYRRIVATSQDGRALMMDFGRNVDPVGLELLKGACEVL